MAERASLSYAPDRVSLAGIAGGALLIAGAIALGIAAGFVILHAGRQGTPVWAAQPGVPPSIAGPVSLQPDPERDIASLRAEKRRILTTYAWVDRAHGIARIPIDRAIVLLARQAAAQTP
jgi:hypothetical protein